LSRPRDWPLPVLAYLVFLLKSDDQARTPPPPRPHYQVLIDLAVGEKRPDDVLRWYDAMCADHQRPGATVPWSVYGASAYDNTVATAVARSHPDRALGIYRECVTAHLREANVSAYETVAAYLRKMRPILKSLDREAEWTQLLGDIRHQYRNRPRLMDILDGCEARTVLQTQRARR